MSLIQPCETEKFKCLGRRIFVRLKSKLNFLAGVFLKIAAFFGIKTEGVRKWQKIKKMSF